MNSQSQLQTRLRQMALLVLCVPWFVFAAESEPNTTTIYDSEKDIFITSGSVEVQVPPAVLGPIAGDFSHYRDWALFEINEAKDGEAYSILFRDVKYRKGGRGGLGIFRVYFDLDWPWPFGAKGKRLDFAVLKARPSPTGGIDHLIIDLEERGTLLKTFELDMTAQSSPSGTLVTFRAKVKFNGFVDTFFSLARFRHNIEYRVVKVIANLQKHAEK